ncbi:uncharacterized protein LOC114173983 [Vigna unguiculata]|uniref:Importin subunit alpha-2 n=1 Tax=Vigna unguiculata TaxID=3917 RepID=A0A4D6LRJ7_VIGUN|nr:uncharacterized protein LOC114173983 [Vigna unguiculata]QCD91115.1 importin subunit alpha-2 [Vigna unguiculata]
MGDIVKKILAKPIQLADQVTKAADEATSFKQECAELKSKTEKLAALLRQAARASSELYERPTRRIIDETEQVLDKALALVLKCRGNALMKRVFTLNPSAAFRKVSSHLENSVGDVSWLLRVSAGEAGGEYLGGLPPIAANEPILCLIWEQIAVLHTGSPEERSDAAASLVSLASGSQRYGKLIIEEGGVGPLLKLLKEGKSEGQENAARAVGLLGRDPESVEHMIHVGACSVLAKILKEGPMKVQGVVAWAVSELAANYPKSQDLFAQHKMVTLLVGHLAFETVEEHSKYAIVSKKPTSIHALVVASSNTNNNNLRKHNLHHDAEIPTRIPHPFGEGPRNLHRVITSTIAMHAANKQGNETNQNNQSKSNGVGNDGKLGNNNQNHQRNYSHSGINMKGRDLEDPGTKSYMKEMAARALWQLAKGNSPICRSITESRALLCFAVLLEKGTEAVQYNSAMAVMEITAVAEKDPELRKSAFKPNSPACKAVVDQVVKIIEKADSDSILLIPCIKTIGNLARTFKATETRMIGPLVRLLDEREAEVTREASIALAKFACTENYLHVDHAKAIISAGGAKHLIQLVYFGEEMVKIPALLLLSYIAMHVPDSDELAQAEVLGVIEWASKQSFVAHNQTLEALLLDSKSKLELYQSRGPRGSHQLHLHH